MSCSAVGNTYHPSLSIRKLVIILIGLKSTHVSGSINFGPTPNLDIRKDYVRHRSLVGSTGKLVSLLNKKLTQPPQNVWNQPMCPFPILCNRPSMLPAVSHVFPNYLRANPVYLFVLSITCSFITIIPELTATASVDIGLYSLHTLMNKPVHNTKVAPATSRELSCWMLQVPLYLA